MATATPTPKEAQGQALEQSLKQYNQDKNLAWTLGTNYSNIGTQFETVKGRNVVSKDNAFKNAITCGHLVITHCPKFFNVARRDSGVVGNLPNTAQVVKTDNMVSKVKSRNLKRM